MRMSDANEESGVGALEISKSNLSVRTATLRDLGTTRSRPLGCSLPRSTFLVPAVYYLVVLTVVQCHGIHVEKQCSQAEEVLLCCAMVYCQDLQLALGLAYYKCRIQ
jgi:hypothetical protein